ncbi:histidine phosphatase family protein [Sulfitobacter sp. JL08]|uniref:histidine phosphatase family protein n=1 Tax=Sulfitobacter sp. JL08 TaxID=2070369 RepID=UPI000E0C5B80|nr:histidine phosphatase family protein [Sulfitobacter sp. JL08]AXI56097.1 histidine phosphatase family protein [Sulfitobacter sp. JL08]
MTRLFMVRHGPTHAKTFVGWSDLPADLSDTAALARLDAHLPPDGVVISSDLIRASATADAIQNKRTRLPHDPDLRELNFGDWELKAFTDIENNDPERARAYWDNPGEVRPPNGESWNDARSRVDRVIDRLLETHSGRDLIVVAHFGVILTQVQRALNIGGYETFGHRIDNLSVTEIGTHPQWAAMHINHIP